MKRVLITGAAGSIGSYLRETLRGRYLLRLSDVRPIDSLADGEEFVAADVTDRDALSPLMEGVHGIVHLGGVPREDDWEPILDVNIVGTYNLFEAARRHRVERFVFASSNHAIGFYPRTQRIDTDVRVRPDSRYGVSKAFAEALGSLYADKYGLRVMSIRIGNVADEPVDARRLSIWVSPRDLSQLVEIGLEHPEMRNEVVYGVSDNARGWWDNSNAERLGYAPRDRSEDYAERVLARAPATDPAAIQEQVQGGDFAVTEKGGGAPQIKDP
jgi:uronate dehydrogenase